MQYEYAVVNAPKASLQDGRQDLRCKSRAAMPFRRFRCHILGSTKHPAIRAVEKRHLLCGSPTLNRVSTNRKSRRAAPGRSGGGGTSCRILNSPASSSSASTDMPSTATFAERPAQPKYRNSGQQPRGVNTHSAAKRCVPWAALHIKTRFLSKWRRCRFCDARRTGCRPPHPAATGRAGRCRC